MGRGGREPNLRPVSHRCRNCKEIIHYCSVISRCNSKRIQCLNCQEKCHLDITMCCHNQLPEELINILITQYDLMELLKY